MTTHAQEITSDEAVVLVGLLRRLSIVFDPAQRYSVDEASALLRQSRPKTYQQINAGDLEVIRDGGRTYVTGRSIAARSLSQND